MHDNVLSHVGNATRQLSERKEISGKKLMNWPIAAWTLPRSGISGQ